MTFEENNQNANNNEGQNGDSFNQSPSPQKLAANRRNAQRSTGPRTAEGKAKSAQNSYKHGFFALKLFIPGEEEGVEGQTSLELGKQIWAYYKPVGCLEEMLVEKIVCESVRYTRLLHHEHEQFIIHHGFSDHVLRYQAAINRQLFQAIERLEQLQANRKAQSIGSEAEAQEAAHTDGAVPDAVASAIADRWDGAPSDGCNRAEWGGVPETESSAPSTTETMNSPRVGAEDSSCATPTTEPAPEETANYGMNPPPTATEVETMANCGTNPPPTATETEATANCGTNPPQPRSDESSTEAVG